MKTFRSLPSFLILALLAGCATTTTTVVTPSKPEAAALAVLSSSQDVHEKARACQELGSLAGPASVQPLAALLNDDKLCDYARSGLEGVRDPSAGAALRKALPTLQGRQLAGVVNSLGVRREKAAVADLRALALDAQRGVAAEAVASLGQIGTKDAAKVLQQIVATGPADLRLEAAHASFIAAEHLAQEGSSSAARELLDAVARAQLSPHLVKVAQNQLAALR